MHCFILKLQKNKFIVAGEQSSAPTTQPPTPKIKQQNPTKLCGFVEFLLKICK